MPFRRMIQVVSFVLFLLLLLAAVSPIFLVLNLDLFLRFDPAIFIITAVSGRTFSLAFIPAMTVLLLSVVFGRVFCGYICPMGTSIDGSDKLFGEIPKEQTRSYGLRRIKYYVLAFCLGSAFLGVSLIFVASPVSLITRFYGLVVYPVIAFFADLLLWIIQPLAGQLGLYGPAFFEIPVPRFATQFFIFVFFIALFSCSRFSPRFWCRYICPSGAILALLSRKPVFRRHVSDDCTDCGKCAQSCPMGAIDKEDPVATCHTECITCRICEDVCPVKAVSFSGKAVGRGPEFSRARRDFVLSGLAGVGTASVSLTGLNSPCGKPGVGQVAPPGLVRPPGTLPEMEFLARCIRCGECMVACPTNALQPVWLKSGFMGLFSPALTPRRGPCDPECNRCGNICPTDAIRGLPIEERIWARPGTAVIQRERCLAWEHQKKCMVCDEVCPFDAVEFRKEPGNPVTVPEVKEDRCAGCGYCEYHCPVQNESAIQVRPMGALRLMKGSYEQEGMMQGIKISIRPRDQKVQSITAEEFSYGTAPGFDENDLSGTATGFEDEGS